MSEIRHPKFHYDTEDNTLYLNFGEYGRQIELACFSGDGPICYRLRKGEICQNEKKE
jgi:hypothetical protein